jgi:type IV pilus assembly protein PilQ
LRKIYVIGLIILCVLLVLCGSSRAERRYTLRDIRVFSTTQRTSVLIVNSIQPIYKYERLVSPDGLRVDFLNAELGIDERLIKVSDGRVERIELSQEVEEKVHIVRVTIFLSHRVGYQFLIGGGRLLINFGARLDEAEMGDLLDMEISEGEVVLRESGGIEKEEGFVQDARPSKEKSLEEVVRYDLYSITNIQLIETPDAATVKVFATSTPKYRCFKLYDPPRLVFDFIDAKFDFLKKEVPGRGYMIYRVRSSQYLRRRTYITRVVVDLKQHLPYRVELKDDVLFATFMYTERPLKVEVEEALGKEVKPGQLQVLLKELEAEREKVKEIVAKIEKVSEATQAVYEEVRRKKEEIERISGEVRKASDDILSTIGEISRIRNEGENLIKATRELRKKAERELDKIQKIRMEGEERREAREAQLITLDVKDAEIRDVLRLIAHKAKINIVPGAEVRGRVTLHLSRVHWKVALDILLKSYGYTFVKDQGIIRVGSEEQLAKEAETRVFFLNYIDPEEVSLALKPVLSPFGRMQIAKRTNSIIITDNLKNLQRAEEMIRQLDKKTLQVLIEAKVVKVYVSEMEGLGVDWDVLLSKDLDKDKEGRELSIGFSDKMTADGMGGEDVVGGTVFNFGIVSDPDKLNIKLNALIKEDKAEVISEPKVLSLNNEESRLLVGYEVPYTTTTTADGTVTQSVNFREVGIRLTVTPSINKEGYIMLDLHPEVSDYTWHNGYPVIDTTETHSQILVKDGQTIAIGGLLKEEEKWNEYRVPFLSELPFIGGLFKGSFKEKVKTDILIFVTPKIVSDS